MAGRTFGLPHPHRSTRSSNVPIVEKLGTLGEGRKRKRLEEYVKLTNSFEPEIEELTAGDLAQMRTGEGKTLAATLPTYLNGLTGKGVHVVTVNDYLVKRDSEWMGPIH